MKFEIGDVCTTVVEEFNFEGRRLLGSDTSILVDTYLHVRGMCCLHLQNRRVNQIQKIGSNRGKKSLNWECMWNNYVWETCGVQPFVL